MLKKILLVVVVLIPSLLSSFAVAASGSNIVGIVKDTKTGEPLPGANVALTGTSLGASTDVDGKYVIRNVPPGNYTIRASYIGYEPVAAGVQVISGVELKQDFNLTSVAIQGEVVVVTAQAAGQNEAINKQLSSQQIVSVVSAARIQELPDANAAEAVGRLPGVAILRSGGEGNEVIVRGLQPKYNAIMIDGVRMASSNSSDRSTDLSMISPYMLEGIEVTKAVTPDQDADVLGGTVNFKLKEAGADKEGVGINLLAEGGYNGLSNAENPLNNYKYVASVENRFFDDRSLGLFAQADLERRNLASNEFGASFLHLGSSTTDYITQSLNLDDVPRDRQRANGTIVMDYRLPNGKISLMNFFSSGTTTVQDRGEVFDIQNNLHDYSLAYSKSTVNIITNTLDADQQLSIFHVDAKFSHTYSETDDPGDWTIGFKQASAGLAPFLNQANLYPEEIPKSTNNDLSSTYLNSLTSDNSFSRERALTASLDMDTPLNITDKVSSIIKFGGKYRYQTRSYDYNQYSGQGLGLTSANYIDNLIAAHFPGTAQYVNTTSIPMGPFVDPNFSYGKFLNGDYTMVHPLNFGMLSDLANFVRSNASIIQQNDAISYFYDNFNSATNNYTGHEDQSAFYAMATVNIGPEISIIPGVRYQDLQTTYSGSRGIQTTASATGGGPYLHYDTTLTVDHAYWLPDLTLRYKPLSWFDVRLSYTNTLAYPDYNAIVPRIDVATGGAISWNNYQLVPSRSRNYDAYLSFYDNSIGLFTAGGFLKQIDDLIYPWNFYVSGSSATPYYPPNLATSAPNGEYDVSTYVNDPYRINNWGMEFDWQTHFWYLPRPFDGLVLNVNYTHIFSRAQYPYTLVEKVGRQIVYVDTAFTDRLLDQPDNIANLSIGYDYKGFSIRVSMLYQDNIWTNSDIWPQTRASTAAYTRWDISVKQALPWYNLQLFGDLNNVNGADDVSVIQAATGVPRSEQSYGLTADMGLRWQF
ncbi:MAG: TonB-dependent receptor [Bacteroidota bacterium]